MHMNGLSRVCKAAPDMTAVLASVQVQLGQLEDTDSAAVTEFSIG